MSKQPLQISLRTTRSFTPGWNHLDRWIDLATAGHTQPRRERVCNQDGDTDHRFLVVFSPQEWAKAKRQLRAAGLEARHPHGWMQVAIADTLANGCTCEHDCCGCVQQYADASYLGKRCFSVRLHRYRNI